MYTSILNSSYDGVHKSQETEGGTSDLLGRRGINRSPENCIKRCYDNSPIT
jgi:hypothetical protein